MKDYLIYSIYLLRSKEGGIRYCNSFNNYTGARWEAIKELGKTDYYDQALIYEESIGLKGRKVRGLVGTVKL